MKKLAVLFTILASAVVSHGQNLLLNGNFETNLDANSGPDNWGSWAAGGGVDYKNDGFGGNPGYFVNAWGGSWGNSAGWYQTVAASAGLSYTLSVDSATEGWWNPEGKIAILFKDAAGNNLQNNELVVANFQANLPWTTYSLTRMAPENTAQITVDLKFWGGGAVLFDNAVLTLVPEPATSTIIVLGAGLMMALRRRTE